TLSWQRLREPAHEKLIVVASPDGRWECVVERYDPGLIFGDGPPWRTFKICQGGDTSNSPEPIDGSIYRRRSLNSFGVIRSRRVSTLNDAAFSRSVQRQIALNQARTPTERFTAFC